MTETLPGLLDSSDALTPFTIIRTETALSRFPIHRLAKKGDVQIEIKNQAAALLWEVTYNSKYGQPGPLAYKLDTIVVNRRIEEAKREAALKGEPMPRTVRLGSLRDICRELGNSEGGESTQSVRQALLQNASAFINAKITYKTSDRTERTLEAGFTRYEVVFTGQKMSNGVSADAVYLLLNETFSQVMEAAVTRPLDFDYMRSLPPSAQRFYEIASYQIYAAFYFNNERARVRYSEYCLLSTATRYLTFDQVKKQMYKVHKPHLESGYLGKVSYESTTDDAGQPDWWMCYLPGPNASREYREFTGTTLRVGGRGKKRVPSESTAADSLVLPLTTPKLPPAPPTPVEVPQALPAPTDADEQALIAQLVAADLNQSVAERFARERPEECRRQLEYLPYKTDFKSSRGAYLRRAIEQGFAAPTAYTAKQKELQEQERKRQLAERKSAAEAARKAAETLKAAQVDEAMARLRSEAPEAFFLFEAFVADELRLAETRLAGMSESAREKVFRTWEKPEKRRELFAAWQTKQAMLPNPAPLPRVAPAQPVDAVETDTVSSEDPDLIRRLIQQSFQPENDPEKEG